MRPWRLRPSDSSGPYPHLPGHRVRPSRPPIDRDGQLQRRSTRSSSTTRRPSSHGRSKPIPSATGFHRGSNNACRRALAFDLINVHRVESILLQDLDQLTLPLQADPDTKIIPIQPRFQRPQGSFTHPQPKETNDDRSQTQP